MVFMKAVRNQMVLPCME